MPADPQRIALVLGAGGITGGSYHAGTLAALAEAGWDARQSDLIIGTSAGAVVGSLLRGGLPPVDLVNRLTRSPLTAEGAKLLGDLGPTPDPPQLEGFRLPSVTPLEVAVAARRHGSVNPFAIAAAALPEGRARNDHVARLLEAVVGQRWPDDELWIVAVRQRDGQRVVFGRGDEPRPGVGPAAAASAAVPGLFAPVRIDGQRHVDGGVWSVHNADLVPADGFDLVVVSAPMALDHHLPIGRPSRAAAWAIRSQLDREVGRLRRAGAEVVVIAPDADDRRIMGPSPMDASKRVAVAEHVHDEMSRRLRHGRLERRLRRLLEPH